MLHSVLKAKALEILGQETMDRIKAGFPESHKGGFIGALHSAIEAKRAGKPIDFAALLPLEKAKGSVKLWVAPKAQKHFPSTPFNPAGKRAKAQPAPRAEDPPPAPPAPQKLLTGREHLAATINDQLSKKSPK